MIIHMALPAKIVRSDEMKLLVATNPLSQLALYETELCIWYNSQFFVFLFACVIKIHEKTFKHY